jgi:hypothetical protein
VDKAAQLVGESRAHPNEQASGLRKIIRVLKTLPGRAKQISASESGCGVEELYSRVC